MRFVVDIQILFVNITPKNKKKYPNIFITIINLYIVLINLRKMIYLQSSRQRSVIGNFVNTTT